MTPDAVLPFIYYFFWLLVSIKVVNYLPCLTVNVYVPVLIINGKPVVVMFSDLFICNWKKQCRSHGMPFHAFQRQHRTTVCNKPLRYLWNMFHSLLQIYYFCSFCNMNSLSITIFPWKLGGWGTLALTSHSSF